MCRYAVHTYKPTYACFACRKAFKRMLPADIGYTGPPKAARCPGCGAPMANIGPDVAPPKQRDVKAWKLLDDLWEIGETFHSCGCSGPGYRPRSDAHFDAYLTELHDRFTANLAAARRTGEPQQAQAEAYWTERLARLDAFRAARSAA